MRVEGTFAEVLDCESSAEMSVERLPSSEGLSVCAEGCVIRVYLCLSALGEVMDCYQIISGQGHEYNKVAALCVCCRGDGNWDL